MESDIIVTDFVTIFHQNPQIRARAKACFVRSKNRASIRFSVFFLR
jgi:hypothetical protein